MDGTQPLLGKMFSKKRTEKEEVIRLTSCIQGPQVDWNEIIDNSIVFHFPTLDNCCVVVVNFQEINNY